MAVPHSVSDQIEPILTTTPENASPTQTLLGQTLEAAHSAQNRLSSMLFSAFPSEYPADASAAESAMQNLRRQNTQEDLKSILKDPGIKSRPRKHQLSKVSISI